MAQRCFLVTKRKTDFFIVFFFIKIDQVLDIVLSGMDCAQREMKLILNFSHQFSVIFLWYKTRTNYFPKLWLFTTTVPKPTYLHFQSIILHLKHLARSRLDTYLFIMHSQK